MGIDDDDRHTHAAVPDLQQRFPFVSFYTGKRWDNLSTGYYNPLAVSASRGRYCQLLNDDTEYTTPGWDTKSLEVLDASFPDRLFLGRTMDNTGCQNAEGTTGYSCFPLLPREVISLFGWAQPPTYSGWGADVHLNKVYGPIKREVNLPIGISHLCHHNKERPRDGINKRMSRLSRYAYNTVGADQRKLVAAIEAKKNPVSNELTG